MSKDVEIELLYTDACPNAAHYLPRLRELIVAAGMTEAVQVRMIDDPEQAERERFLGSPTVRVDGRDVEPAAAHRRDYGLSCRLYVGPNGVSGTPPDDWVLALLGTERNDDRLGQDGAR